MTRKRLLLAGAGHAHLHVLHALASDPPSDIDVTLISPFSRLMYSGMLPGWVARHYALDQCSIDLAPLLKAGLVRWVQAHVSRVDLAQCVAYIEAGQSDAAEAVAFDCMSINTGPVLADDCIAGLHEYGIPFRPLEGFIARWQRLIEQLDDNTEPVTLSVIGGGAGGVELALAIAFRAQTARWPLHVQLIAGSRGLLSGMPASMHARGLRQLRALNVRVIEDDAAEINRHTVMLANGGELTSHASIVAIGTSAAQWPAASGLGTDQHGFISVNEFLQSTSHPFIFAAGDCATMFDHPRPKSGVYAVRAGPPLAQNLLRFLRSAPLKRYVPQRQALYLLSTGRRYAVANWRGWSFEGEWVWRWKNLIDRQFMQRYKSNP